MKLPPLPEGNLAIDQSDDKGVMVYSITAHALCELDRHRWIESEHAGFDVCHDAYEDWLVHCWKGLLEFSKLRRYYQLLKE